MLTTLCKYGGWSGRCEGRRGRKPAHLLGLTSNVPADEGPQEVLRRIRGNSDESQPLTSGRLAHSVGGTARETYTGRDDEL